MPYSFMPLIPIYGHSTLPSSTSSRDTHSDGSRLRCQALPIEASVWLARKAANGRVILAHLGNGASMAAVRDGRGVETTMALTPSSGLVMSTRAGNLDPARRTVALPAVPDTRSL